MNRRQNNMLSRNPGNIMDDDIINEAIVPACAARGKQVKARVKQIIMRQHLGDAGSKQDLKCYSKVDTLEYGITDLEYAVCIGSTAEVDRQLRQCRTPTELRKDVRRAMLFAIQADNVDMVAHLVQRHKTEGWCSRFNDSCQCDTKPEVVTESSPEACNEVREFSEEITPIVLAAQMEKSHIIRQLLNGCWSNIHPMTQTDKSHKDCYVCNEREKFVGRHSIEDCQKAIEVYKALATPAYMFEAGVDDPILEAFIINDLMERRKILDPAFVEAYSEISTKCSSLSTHLLSLCHSQNEVEALLEHTGGIDEIHAKYHAVRYPRLMVAIHFNQKEFIAHPYCQQVVQNLWYQGLPEWVCQMNLPYVRFALYCFLLLVGMPFILLLYMFRFPYVNMFVRPPVSKFIIDVTTYLCFLGFLLINGCMDQIHQRGSPPTFIELIIMVWLMGYTIRFIRMSVRMRGICCVDANLMDTVFNVFGPLSFLLFWMYFGLKFGLYIMTVGQGKAPTMERHSLSGWDPFLLSEIFYAVACGISVANLCSFFKASSMLGPLQVSIKPMLFDVCRFMVMFVITVLAFSITLTTLYDAYDGSVREDPITGGDRREQSDAFHGLAGTYKTLFWNLFGHGDPTHADVVVSNLNVTGINGTIIEKGELVKHKATEMTGYVIYSTYHFLVIVVLFNMLIAMMANSYNRIEKNSEIEWRFARTRLIMHYENELGILVPPFNLLPIRYLLGLLMFRKCWKQKSRSFVDYEQVMKAVTKRYWRYHKEEEDRDWRCRERELYSKMRSKGHQMTRINEERN